MGALRLVIVLVTAAAAALGLALTVRHLSASRPAAAMAATLPPKPEVRVLVARRDLEVGHRLTPEDVAWQAWPQGAVNPAFVTGGPVDPKASLADKAGDALQAAVTGDPAVQRLAGSLVREPVLANEPINGRKLVKGGQGGFMAVKLPSGMRAMSVPVTVESGAGGFILPGDHVDVVQSVKLSGGSQGGPAQPVRSRTILRNLTVLAIDQAVEPKAGAATLVGTTATLQVAAADIDVLARAKDEGALMLALRSYEDMKGPEGRVEPAAPARRAVRPAGPRAEPIAVRLYRGGKVTELRVP